MYLTINKITFYLSNLIWNLYTLGTGGFSAASAIQQDDPIVESVPDAEHLTSTLIIAGGEGYIDFRSGNFILIYYLMK